MIVVGQLATPDGAATSSVVELTPSGRGAVEHRHYYWAAAVEYRSTQPARIPVVWQHGTRVIGETRFLARRGSGLFGVFEVDDDVELPRPFYVSGEVEGHYGAGRYRDITLNAVGVVERSATVAKRPAVAVTGTLDDAHTLRANDPYRPLLREAADYCRTRRYRPAQPHVVADDCSVRYSPTKTAEAGLRPIQGLGPVEHSAHRGRVLSVNSRPVGMVERRGGGYVTRVW